MSVAVTKPRIMFVHERYGRMAGAEQNIYVTAPHLAEHFDLSFLYWQRTGRDEETLDGIFRAHQVDFDGDPAAVRRATIEALDRERPDLVYVHKCLSLPLIEEMLARDLPMVRMEHDHDIYCMRSYKYFPLSRRICTHKAGLCCLFPCLAFLRRQRGEGALPFAWVSFREQMRQIHVNRRFDAFFVVTNYMKEELVRQGFAADRIHIMPPVPVPETRPAPSTFGDRNLILYIGQIVRGKGVDCLLRSLARVPTPFELVILGDGSHRQYCEALTAELGLGSRVTFRGYVGKDVMNEYYREATLVAVPSVWPEPIATVGLEALRRGMPVVGFDAGGIRDWLRDGQTGYLIPWMDLEKMAERIDYLLTHKDEARRLGAQGRAFVDDVYDFDGYIARMVGHFRRLTAAREGAA